MTRKIPDTGRGSPRIHGTPSFLGEGVPPWGRRIQISPIWAPMGRSGGCPGDEITKTGAYCFRENPVCPPIAGLRGLSCPEKGPNGPKWEGDNSGDGLGDEGITERGYGEPGRNAGTRETLAIGTLTRHMTSPDSPTWKLPVYPVGRRQQEPDPTHFGDEIAKTGAYCFRESSVCPPIVGFAGLSVSKKGPNGPKWRGDNLGDGLGDVKTGKPGSGDPVRNAPAFPGTGDEEGENTKDRTGRYPA